jgi:hypothetical protein
MDGTKTSSDEIYQAPKDILSTVSKFEVFVPHTQ